MARRPDGGVDRRLPTAGGPAERPGASIVGPGWYLGNGQAAIASARRPAPPGAMPPASGGTGEQQQQQPMDCASLEADKDHDAMFNDPVSLRAITSEYRTLKARVPQLEADLEVARADATEARLERAAAAAAADRPPPRPEQSPWLSLTNGTLVTVSGLVGTCKERSVNIMMPHIGIAFHLSRAIFELAPQRCCSASSSSRRSSFRRWRRHTPATSIVCTRREARALVPFSARLEFAAQGFTAGPRGRPGIGRNSAKWPLLEVRFVSL